MKFQISSFFYGFSLSLFLSFKGQALPVPEDITPQNEQIQICRKFAENPSPENYNEFKELSKKNFKIIEDTIIERFGRENKKYKAFQQDLLEANNSFDRKEMNFKSLTKFYFKCVISLDNNPQPSERYIADAWRDIDQVCTFSIPIPVVSLDGIAKMGKLCDLISRGYCYLGVPLQEYVSFDGEKSGPLRFFRHDLFHAEFLGTPVNREKTLKFLQTFDEIIANKIQTPQEKKIINLIKFIAFHEKGQNLYQIIPSEEDKTQDENLLFQKFANNILCNTIINTKIHNFYQIYGDFLPYVEKKKLMTFPENASEREKTVSFAHMINQKIEALMEIVSNSIFNKK